MDNPRTTGHTNPKSTGSMGMCDLGGHTEPTPLDIEE